MRWSVPLCLLVAMLSAPAAAQDRRLVEVQFTPTGGAQLALWIEAADGSRFETLRLTESVAYRGIGNRPGASMMNSGFRWPYGRREGALPVWAHRRVAAGAPPFRRVIFQARIEGNASRRTADHSLDDHFCLSFQRELSGREALDAVSCASPFNSDKGRYLSEADVAAGYSEPVQEGDSAGMRAMDLASLYPPRRDLGRCALGGVCHDHADVASFRTDALEAMPELDAVTMATPPADVAQSIVFEVPEEWPSGDYIAYLEISVEGDYNAAFGPEGYPTPTNPAGQWDYWAMNYGYPYRGQPSVVYAVPFRVGGVGSYTAAEPLGHGSLSGTGEDGGRIHPIEGGSISDDPTDAPGSGADRLRFGGESHRVRVVTVGGEAPTEPEPMVPECDPLDPDPDPACCEDDDPECQPTEPGPGPGPAPVEPPSCEGAIICQCREGNAPPAAVTGLEAVPHADPQRGHEWGELSFVVPSDDGGSIARYEVRIGTAPIVTDEDFLRAVPAKEAAVDSIELVVPTDGAAGSRVDVQVGGLSPQTRYYIGIRARDACDDPGPLTVVELETTAVVFTTVSPCFVATAAYGSPMASEIHALRRVRDRHLQSNIVGRAFVSAYYAFGPSAARFIAETEERRAVARRLLSPVVRLARWLD